MEELAVQLDSYSRLGIPKLQHCQDSTLDDKVEEGNCRWRTLPFLLLVFILLAYS